MREINDILQLLATRADAPAVLATLVAVEGSSYRKPGARLLWFADGVRTGTISGGCLEEDVIERARRVLVTGRTEVATYDTTSENDLVWGLGTGCSGTVRVFLERLTVPHPSWVAVLRENRQAGRDTPLAVVHKAAAEADCGTRLAAELRSDATLGLLLDTVPPPPALFVFGAGDDARPLVRMAAELGWRVTVVDSRAAYATAERFPDAARLVVAPPAAAVAHAGVEARAHVVVMSHRYRDDTELLRQLLARPLAYLGQLGPIARTNRMLAELGRSGLTVTAEMRARLHAPVGLDLGGKTPETVALAILAEIQARLTGRTPGFLRDTADTRHRNAVSAIPS